uniref:Uncharacterized protein n=2 Tax=Lepeophtheirus salmonis TaxID=72036 RepID=A0A0K2UNT9_LEPSM
MPRSTSLSSSTSLRSSLRLKTSLGNGSDANRMKDPPIGGLKRKASAVEGNGRSLSKASKRAAFEDITNAADNERINNKTTIKNQMKKGLTSIRSNFANKKIPVKKKAVPVISSHVVRPNIRKLDRALPKPKITSNSPKFIDSEREEILGENVLSSQTSSQDESKSFGGIALSDSENEPDRSHNKWIEETEKKWPVPPEGVIDFDLENINDPNQCSIYAAEIFDYYRSRESQFAVADYMKTGSHPEINESMRSILVDWLVEVQESFELNHETLYTSVKIFDLYLSLEKSPVKKDELQLIGATACLIACKVDERLPPPLDDFVYVCDDAYSREQIIVMERRIIQTVNYDVGYPLSYRFLRRFGRVCKVTMPVLTLARYILEMSLMKYEFNICGTSESKLAAAALILAFKIHGILGWVDTLKYYSGYSPVKDLKEIVMKLYKVISEPHLGNLKTIKDKYSHIVFHEVALVPIPERIVVDED